MDNAVAVNPALPLAQPAGFGARLAALPAKNKFGLGLGLAALAAVVMAMTMWSSQGDYKVLYANLSDKDGGAIIAQLSQMNVPYRHADGGAAILVPASKVHDVRLKLASAGLPKGSVVGYELMDGARFGQTQFQERLTAQRGLVVRFERQRLTIEADRLARQALCACDFRERQISRAVARIDRERAFDQAIGGVEVASGARRLPLVEQRDRAAVAPRRQDGCFVD